VQNERCLDRLPTATVSAPVQAAGSAETRALPVTLGHDPPERLYQTKEAKSVRHRGYRKDVGHTQGLIQTGSGSAQCTTVDDDALAHLKGCKELKQLGIKNTQVTDKGVQDFEKARPDVKVSR